MLLDEAREARVTQARALLNQRKTELAAKRKLVEKGTMPKLDPVRLETQFKTAEAAWPARKPSGTAASYARRGRALSPTSRSRSGRRRAADGGREIAQIVSLDPIVAVVEVAERN